MSYEFYKSDDVRSLARGNWLEIFNALSPALEPALRKPGKHVPCPVHQGTNGFRLFKDSHETGGAICNTCGKFSDGFAVLMWIYDWDFKTALNEVGDVIGAPKTVVNNDKNDNKKSNGKSPYQDKPMPAVPAAIQQDVCPNPNPKPRKAYDGVLTAFGKDHYDFKSENEQSFYAKVVGDAGVEKTMWGVDLERAIADVDAQIGDSVVIKNLGREPVTVMVDQFDEQGNVVGEKPRKTHRNTYVVEILRRVNPQMQIVPKALKAVGESQSIRSGGNIASIEMAIPDAGLQESQRNLKNVVPLFKQEAKPWLLAAKEEMQRRQERRKEYGAKRAEKTLNIWESCVDYYSPKASAFKRYLDHRNLACRMSDILESDCLRFHPQLPYYDEDGVEKGRHPAIVAAIRDVDGNLITLHRTYLTSNGKKIAFGESKKMVPIPDGLNINGAAIQLGVPVDGILGVAEGLETALSPYRATGIPTWSTVNSALMESFEPPANVHTVLIWADKDRSGAGERAAQKLKTRMIESGRKCYILLPKMPIAAMSKGVDWNDVLMTQGVIGFPSGRYIRNFVATARGESYEQ